MLEAVTRTTETNTEYVPGRFRFRGLAQIPITKDPRTSENYDYAKLAPWVYRNIPV